MFLVSPNKRQVKFFKVLGIKSATNESKLFFSGETQTKALTFHEISGCNIYFRSF